MKTSKALHEAAKDIFYGREAFSCNAAFHRGHYDAVNFYRRHLSPAGGMRISSFAGPECRHHETEAVRLHRVMALLLAAEIAKSEGL